MKQMQVITTKQLRDNLSEVLERVAIGGQRFRVPKFGKTKACVVPANDVKGNQGKLVSGIADQPLVGYQVQDEKAKDFWKLAGSLKSKVVLSDDELRKARSAFETNWADKI